MDTKQLKEQCLLYRYYMVGGSDPGLAGGSAGSSQAQAASKVFGPGVIGSDPTLGEDLGHPPWPMGGLRGSADDSSQQTGVSQVATCSSSAHEVTHTLWTARTSESQLAVICMHTC